MRKLLNKDEPLVDYKLKKFLGWKLLSIMAFFSILFQIVLEIIKWNYLNEINLNFKYILINLIIMYINILCVSVFVFKLVKWLNKIIIWSTKTAVLRTIIDVIVFSFVTNFWIIFVNQVIFFFKSKGLLEFNQIIFFIAIGTLVNLFLVPIIELMLLFNMQYQTQLHTKQLLHENTKFKYEVLKNQINPHFLFNSISVLSSLISINSDKAKIYTNSFSLVFRHVLDFRNINTIKLCDEVKFLEHYIFMLKTRFGEAFQIQLNFSDEFSQKLILPMVLQLLVENAIKHNKMSEKEPLLVDILANNEGIYISNKLRLKSSVASWGIGLANIKMRYVSFGYKVIIEKTETDFKVFIPYISSSL